VLQCVAAMLISAAMLMSLLLKTFKRCVAVCCSVEQRVAVCCSDVDLGRYVDELTIKDIQQVCCSVL